MKITSKNLIILMIIIFFIFNYFIGMAYGAVKAILFFILFLYILSILSTDLYNSIINSLNLKYIPFPVIFKFINKSIVKLKQNTPVLNNIKVNNIINKESDTVSDEQIDFKVN